MPLPHPSKAEPRRHPGIVALGSILGASALIFLCVTPAVAERLVLTQDVEVPPPVVVDPPPPPPPPPGCRETTVRTEDDSGTTIQIRTDCPPLPPPEAPLPPPPPPPLE